MRRGGHIGAFFDGLEALRARVEDPQSRKTTLDIDFASLRDDLVLHISKFELFRPLLWAFFQGLLRADERRLAEMLLAVLMEALPAAIENDHKRLTAACDFVARGAVELQAAGAPGIANRVLLNALARFQRSMIRGDAETADERVAWTTLLGQIIATLPLERDRLLLGYTRQALDHVLWHAKGFPAGQERAAALWQQLLDRCLRAVAPGSRSSAVDHLFRRLSQMIGRDGGPVRPDFEPVVERLVTSERFRQWWVGYVERRTAANAGDPAMEGLPPEMLALAQRALRHRALDESPAALGKRLGALSALGSAKDLPRFEPLLASPEAWQRRAGVQALHRLIVRLAAAEADRAVDRPVARLVEMLTDPDDEVLRLVVRALGTSGRSGLAGPLEGLYRERPESEQLLRADILDALVTIERGNAGVTADQAAFFTEQRRRYEALARGRLRDRILASLHWLESEARKG